MDDQRELSGVVVGEEALVEDEEGAGEAPQAPVHPPPVEVVAGGKALRSCTPNRFVDIWDWVHNIHDVGSTEHLFDKVIHQTFVEPGHRLVDVDAALSVGYLHSAMQVLHVALDKWALQKSEAQLWKPFHV